MHEMTQNDARQHLTELRNEHRELDAVIAHAIEYGPVDQIHLQKLKKRKLMLKDQITWLERKLIPDIIA